MDCREPLGFREFPEEIGRDEIASAEMLRRNFIRAKGLLRPSPYDQERLEKSMS